MVSCIQQTMTSNSDKNNRRIFPTKSYLLQVCNYTVLVDKMSDFSKYSRCIAKTNKFFYLSSLFTMICVRANTLKKILPIFTTREDWDYASIYSLSRILVENCLFFLWFCEGEDVGDLVDLKINLINYHDCMERLKLFKLIGDEENILFFSSELIKLKNSIMNNTIFNELPQDENHFSKNDLLKGRSASFEKYSYIAMRYGYEKKEYILSYKYKSQFIHSFPISFHRMEQDYRGCGVYSKFEEDSIKSSLNELSKILRKAFSMFKKARKRNS